MSRMTASTALLEVRRYRVSPRAKIRWEKVRMYLNTIVQMGWENKRKMFDIMGTVPAGGFYGHAQCIAKVPYPCSLVAADTCSYCVLNVDDMLRIAKEYPVIAVELQAALGRCIAAAEMAEEHSMWQRSKADFLTDVRKRFTGEESNKGAADVGEIEGTGSFNQLTSSVLRRASLLGEAVFKRKASTSSSVVVAAADDGPARAPPSPAAGGGGVWAGESTKPSPQKRPAGVNSKKDGATVSLRGSQRDTGSQRVAPALSILERAQSALNMTAKMERVEVLIRKVDRLQELFASTTLRDRRRLARRKVGRIAVSAKDSGRPPAATAGAAGAAGADDAAPTPLLGAPQPEARSRSSLLNRDLQSKSRLTRGQSRRALGMQLAAASSAPSSPPSAPPPPMTGLQRTVSILTGAPQKAVEPPKRPAKLFKRYKPHRSHADALTVLHATQMMATRNGDAVSDNLASTGASFSTGVLNNTDTKKLPARAQSAREER
jgi:hypothetical protein